MRALTSLAENYDSEIASFAPQNVIQQVILQLQSTSMVRTGDAIDCLGSFSVSDDCSIVDNAINSGLFPYIENILQRS